jgi:hypothetical protein
MHLQPKTIKRLERIAFCGEGYHKIINMAMHTFPMGNLDPETAWKVTFDDKCERCTLRFEAAKKAYKAGLMAGRNS